MSDEVDQESKTEAPSEKRLEDARKKGQVAMAPEVKHIAMFGGAYFLVAVLGAGTAARLSALGVDLFERAGSTEFTADAARGFAWWLSGAFAGALAPVFALFVAAAILGGVAQGRFLVSWERVKPKWSKISPVAGFKRVFNLAEFLKTLAKFSVVLVAVLVVLAPSLWVLEKALYADTAGVVGAVAELIRRLFFAVLLIVAVVAFADLVYQRMSFTKRMRMSRQELKEEHKQNEGSPEIKAKVRQIQRERSRRRMMQAVPNATVIITNPTHYSVALQYDHEAGLAPVVVAKGVDEMALKIRQIAKAAGVPIVENVPLARALYAQVDIEDAIPQDLFKPVAEVIGFVMRLGGQGR